MLASLYFIVLCASSLLLIALSFVGWTRRRLPSGTSFFLLMASSAFYLVCNVGFMISADRETAYLFARLQTLGINLACVHLLVFSLAHTGRRHRLTLAALAPWYALAIGTFLVVWTDPVHHWYFRSFDIQRIDGLTFRTGSFGWWLPVLIGIQFIPPLYGVALLTLEYRAAQGILRRQYAWLIITACLPPAVSAMIALLRMLGVEALTHITPLPLALTAVALSTLRVVLRDQLLDLMPIAQPLIFDEIPEAIIITDLQGRITQLNPVARTLRGLGLQEGIGRLSSDLFPELSSIAPGSIVRIQPAGAPRPKAYECTFRKLHWRDQPVGQLAILHDVTERLRAEEAYRTVVDRSLQGFAILQDGRVVFANHTFFRMFGSDPSMIAEFNAGRVADGVHPEDLPRVLDGMQRLASHEIDVVRGEFRLLTKTQEAVWVEIQAAHTDYHGASAVQIALVDITEQRLARQHELDAQLERERAEVVSQFVTGAAHELRTPLSIINTQAYLMARLADAGDRQRSAALIAAQVFRTSRLVDVMLKMARLQRSSPKLIPIVPGDIVRQACAAIDQTGRTLHAEITEPAPKILGDMELLLEALKALIDNARRFGPPDGVVVVKVCTAGEFVCIAVHDQGNGIAPDQMDRIFETFWRGDAAHTTPGMGLGLPIARRIVEMHRGSIGVESAPGVGSTFRINLPIYVEAT